MEKTATGKQPYAIALAGRRLMAPARLWETRRSPAGQRIRSVTIVSSTPNELCAQLHNRMPVVLKPQAWPVWLGEQSAGAVAQGAASHYPPDEMICWPVSAPVGNVKNSGITICNGAYEKAAASPRLENVPSRMGDEGPN